MRELREIRGYGPSDLTGRQQLLVVAGPEGAIDALSTEIAAGASGRGGVRPPRESTLSG